MITCEPNNKKCLEKNALWEFAIKKYIVFYGNGLFYTFIVLLTSNKNISKDIFFLI